MSATRGEPAAEPVDGGTATMQDVVVDHLVRMADEYEMEGTRSNMFVGVRVCVLSWPGCPSDALVDLRQRVCVRALLVLLP